MAGTVTNTSNALYWLALSLTPGLGPTRGRKLVEHFDRIEDIFQASLTELEAVNLQAQSAQHIALGKSLELAHEEYGKALAEGVHIIARGDAAWPERLSEIYDPPLVLYIRGNVEAVARPGIAVVGTRRASTYGREVTRQIVSDLARNKITIVSGLAPGARSSARSSVSSCVSVRPSVQ